MDWRSLRRTSLLCVLILTPSHSRADDKQPAAKPSGKEAAAAPSNLIPVKVAGPGDYMRVYVKALAVVGKHFDFTASNRYDGNITGESAPTGQPAVRCRAVVRIFPAEFNEGIYFVEVKVFKEKDASPPTDAEPKWVPAGREGRLESIILRRLAKSLGSEP